MLFCPKCGSLLKSKTERGKNVMFCSCGFSSKKLDNAEIKEKIEQDKKQKVEVVDKEVETYPTTTAICDKCKNDKAYYWLVQTRAGDEAETKFLKCTKCGHTWRDYD
jgi:DNA-directed RNA polymerase subunit M